MLPLCLVLGPVVVVEVVLLSSWNFGDIGEMQLFVFGSFGTSVWCGIIYLCMVVVYMLVCNVVEVSDVVDVESLNSFYHVLCRLI